MRCRFPKEQSCQRFVAMDGDCFSLSLQLAPHQLPSRSVASLSLLTADAASAFRAARVKTLAFHVFCTARALASSTSRFGSVPCDPLVLNLALPSVGRGEKQSKSSSPFAPPLTKFPILLFLILHAYDGNCKSGAFGESRSGRQIMQRSGF